MLFKRKIYYLMTTTLDENYGFIPLHATLLLLGQHRTLSLRNLIEVFMNTFIDIANSISMPREFRK